MTDKRSLPGILPSFSSPNWWTVLVVAGIGLFVVTLGVSGVVAPPVEEATADSERQ